MAISDGQPVNAAASNAAWISKNTDDTAVARTSWNSGQPSSGPAWSDVQREVNSLDFFTGRPANSAYNAAVPWTTSVVGTSGDNLEQRSEALTLKFRDTGAHGGHTHTGVDGDAPKIAATGVDGIRSGTSAITNGTTSLVVAFSSTLGTTNYSIISSMSNIVDGFPEFQPITITAKTSTGFTASWNTAIDSVNYNLEWFAAVYV